MKGGVRSAGKIGLAPVARKRGRTGNFRRDGREMAFTEVDIMSVK
jgi:hypothetical protein